MILKTFSPKHIVHRDNTLYQSHQNTNDVICLKDVSVSYRNKKALDSITGTFKKGSFTAVIGPNGGGKSTLLKSIMGMVPLQNGLITLDRSLQDAVAYLPQQSDIDRSFPLSVQDVVASGYCQHHGFFSRFNKVLQNKIKAALDQVGMADCIDRPLGSLSGGQFQRVLFARLALQDAKCILLDEPFTAIDTYTIADLINLLQLWHKAGKTLIVVNHDLDLVRDYFPETLLLACANLGWGTTEKVVTIENLRKAKKVARQLHAHESEAFDTLCNEV